MLSRKRKYQLRSYLTAKDEGNQAAEGRQQQPKGRGQQHPAMHITFTSIFYAGRRAGGNHHSQALSEENNPLGYNSKPLISARLDQSVSKRRSPTAFGN